jgi:hypothetical protein
MSLALTILPGPFGAAEIEGLQPSRDAGDTSTCELLREALWMHGVVCVRLPAALATLLAIHGGGLAARPHAMKTRASARERSSRAAPPGGAGLW